MKNLVRISTIINHLKDSDFSISFKPDEFGIQRYASHSSDVVEELNELLCDSLFDAGGFLCFENILKLKDEGLIKDIIIGEADSFGVLSLIIKFDDRTGMVVG